MSQRRVCSISIHLGKADYCVSVLADDLCPIYLHGSTDDVRAFGREIIEAADRHDEAARASAPAAAADEPAETPVTAPTCGGCGNHLANFAGPGRRQGLICQNPSCDLFDIEMEAAA